MTCCRHHGPFTGEHTPCCLHEAERAGTVTLTLAQLHELLALEVHDLRGALTGLKGRWLDDYLYGYAEQLRSCPDVASCLLMKRIAKLKGGGQ